LLLTALLRFLERYKVEPLLMSSLQIISAMGGRIEQQQDNNAAWRTGCPTRQSPLLAAVQHQAGLRGRLQRAPALQTFRYPPPSLLV
jgi:hypothetical protein